VVPVTDAQILAASCDASVLVIRAEKSTRRLSAHARDALASVGAKMIGFVVNDAPHRIGSPYYHGGYYDYNYGGKSPVPHEIEAIPVAHN
jgi:Mrp family chromosome partitioning ATPase